MYVPPGAESSRSSRHTTSRCVTVHVFISDFQRTSFSITRSRDYSQCRSFYCRFVSMEPFRSESGLKSPAKFFFSIFRGFNKNRARGLVLLVGRIGLIHEGKTAALGSGVLSRAAPHTQSPPPPPRGRRRGERGGSRAEGGGGQAGRKCLGSSGSAPQQGNGYGRSRSPIRAHTGEVQTKCPPHIGKSGQRLTQGA